MACVPVCRVVSQMVVILDPLKGKFMIAASMDRVCVMIGRPGRLCAECPALLRALQLCAYRFAHAPTRSRACAYYQRHGHIGMDICILNMLNEFTTCSWQTGHGLGHALARTHIHAHSAPPTLSTLSRSTHA